MPLATTYCRASVGVEAPLVTVEAHLTNGLPAFNIVGLPEKAVQEARDRVRSALLNAGFEFPARRITVNLAPADLPKQGSGFDLAIAIGILNASGQLSAEAIDGFELIGELALSGELRAVRGILPAAIAARDAERTLILPQACAPEAALVAGGTAVAAKHLLGVIGHLGGDAPLAELAQAPQSADFRYPIDLAEVIGQERAKRALSIAAAGSHHLLFTGSPGTGKSMLASRLPTLLPPMSESEALETAAIRSVSGQPLTPANWLERPFRSPHHTASGVSLVGGGGIPLPGEISLAHNGVLFLDELPEFDRRVLDVLREPLESGRICIARAARSAEFPARFQLIAAMNPCPCGFLGDPHRQCRCTEEQVMRYRRRISGPLLDRFDLCVEVPALPIATLSRAGNRRGATSAEVCAGVTRCRHLQIKRQQCLNRDLAGAALDRYCTLDPAGLRLLTQASERLHLSARSFHRVLRVARTIADLDEQPQLSTQHLAEAIGYRQFDQTDA